MISILDKWIYCNAVNQEKCFGRWEREYKYATEDHMSRNTQLGLELKISG